MASSSVRFTTEAFQFAHGRMPRGFGYWAFDFGQGPVFAPSSMNFGDAKDWARSHARSLNVRVVAVCS